MGVTYVSHHVQPHLLGIYILIGALPLIPKRCGASKLSIKCFMLYYDHEKRPIYP